MIFQVWKYYLDGTHTGQACATCNFDSLSLRLPISGKNCFMGSRRFLPITHRFRQQRTRFDGKTELRHPPIMKSGSKILGQVDNMNVVF